MTLTASDTDSGVAVVEYRIDSGGWLAYTAPFQVDGAQHDIAFRATDVAGNQSLPGSLHVDAAPPTSPVATAAPQVSGKAVVGSTLRATTGSWDQTGLTFTYQWLRDGTPVDGATRARLLLGAADVGHRMSVRVTASRDGLTPGTAQSAATSPVATTARPR